MNVVAAELRGARKAYGSVTALDGVDLTVAPGEIVTLLGPNGAGKTTAIRLLLGLRRPDAGTARLFGLDPHRTEARRRCGTTPQETDLPETLRVREILELVRPTIHGRCLRRTSSSDSDSPRWARVRRAVSPAASGDGWPSPSRSPAIRSSCSSTSRAAASTRHRGARCGSRCGTSSRAGGRFS